MSRRALPIWTLVAGACAVSLAVLMWPRTSPQPEVPAPPNAPPTSATPTLQGAADGRRNPATHSTTGASLPDQGAREPTAIVGRVRRGTAPVAGYEIVLHTDPGSARGVWSLSALPRVAFSETDRSGAFHLVAPPGSYVLQIGALSSAHHRRVLVPSPSPLDVDLGATGEVVVAVLAPDRKPMAGALAGLRDPGGCIQSALTDGDGRATFGLLLSGRYVASGAPSDGVLAFTVDGQAVDLEAPATVVVEVVLSAAVMTAPVRPRPMRIALAGSTRFEGWQARAMYRGTRSWTPVNGDEPILVVRGLDVRAPDGRRWKVRATQEDLATGVLELPTSDVLWRGLLLDRATNKPLVGYTVFAREAASHEVWVGSRTNEAGEFEVRAVRGPDVRLTFYDPTDRKLSGISFSVRDDAVSASSSIQVRIPVPDPEGRLSVPVRSMAGRVWNRDGTPLRPSGEIEAALGGMISVSARIPCPDGVLLLSAPKHTTGISASGTYAIDVYDAEAYAATIYTALDASGRPGCTREFEWLGFAASRDFELD